MSHRPLAAELMRGIKDSEEELRDYGLHVQINSMQDLTSEKRAAWIRAFMKDGVYGITIDAQRKGHVNLETAVR